MSLNNNIHCGCCILMWVSFFFHWKFANWYHMNRLITDVCICNWNNNNLELSTRGAEYSIRLKHQTLTKKITIFVLLYHFLMLIFFTQIVPFRWDVILSACVGVHSMCRLANSGAPQHILCTCHLIDLEIDRIQNPLTVPLHGKLKILKMARDVSF